MHEHTLIIVLKYLLSKWQSQRRFWKCFPSSSVIAVLHPGTRDCGVPVCGDKHMLQWPMSNIFYPACLATRVIQFLLITARQETTTRPPKPKVMSRSSHKGQGRRSTKKSKWSSSDLNPLIGPRWPIKAVQGIVGYIWCLPISELLGPWLWLLQN